MFFSETIRIQASSTLRWWLVWWKKTLPLVGVYIEYITTTGTTRRFARPISFDNCRFFILFRLISKASPCPQMLTSGPSRIPFLEMDCKGVKVKKAAKTEPRSHVFQTARQALRLRLELEQGTAAEAREILDAEARSVKLVKRCHISSKMWPKVDQIWQVLGNVSKRWILFDVG